MNKELGLKDMTKKNDDNTYILNQNDAPQSDEISLRAIEQLLNPKNLKSVSRIKFEQVNVLTKLHLFAKTFKTPFTKDLADLILELQISTNGLGRKELVSLVQRRDGLMDMMAMQQQKPSKDIFR